MAQVLPTTIRIAGTLNSTEATSRLVRAIARERLTFNGARINGTAQAAKAILAATDSAKPLELSSDGMRQGWHEHVEGACREYDLSFEARAYREAQCIRHVAYVGHVGYIEDKSSWQDKSPHLKIMAFPRTSLRDMASGEYPFD